MRINLLITFILLLLVSLVTNIEYINIQITNETDQISMKTIGPNGTFGLVTNMESLSFIFNHSEIEDLTVFEGTFMDKERGDVYKWICRLWDPENMNVVVLCTVDYTILEASNNNFILDHGSIEVGEYYIEVYCDKEYYFEIDMKPFNIPFIYSEPQIINLDSGKDSFQLKFKKDSFLGEKLAIVEKDNVESITDLDNIIISKNVLMCTISRTKIEEVLTNNSFLSLAYLNGDLGFIFFQFVGDISVQYSKPKKNFTLIITEILNPNSEVNSLVALKTNINDISPLTSNKFEIKVVSTLGQQTIQCFLKKYGNEEMPLLLLCENDKEDDYIFDFRDVYLELTQINYKYNFIIKESDIYQEISIKGKGKRIFLNYPDTLDFTKNENYEIEYFLTGSEYFQNITFFRDLPSLQCKEKNYTKTCNINKSHFYGHQAGYYYILYSTNNKSLEISYDARPIKVIIEQNVYIKIKLEDNNDTLIIGRDQVDSQTQYRTFPTISFVTDYDDTESNIFNISDIEETHFEIQFKKEEEEGFIIVTANCRLWKPKYEKIRLFCGMNPILNGNITFNKVSFRYNNYTVIIETEDYFNTERVGDLLPFLYYDEQYIDLVDGKEYYSLKFKYDIYIKEGFFLLDGSNYIPLNDDCQIHENKKEIICQIPRSLIEENLIYREIRESKFQLWTFSEFLGTYLLNSVLPIIISYDISIEKEDININVGFPEQFSAKAGEIIAFRTNSSIAPNIITDKFDVTFLDYDNNYIDYPCYLKISREKTFLNLLCHITKEGDFRLETQTFKINDLHYKYNFIVKIEENFNFIEVFGNGTQVHLTYPISFNLSFQDSVSFKYIMDDPSKEEYLLISQSKIPDENDMVSCKDSKNVKVCDVPVSFFDGKNEGYYYTYHSNSTPFVPYYEANPVYIIFPPRNLIVLKIKKQSSSFIGKNGVIDFVTNFNYTTKIFNETDIEEKIVFNTSITDEENNKYEVTCRLWTPLNDYIRIFCSLNENLKRLYQEVILEEINFTYKDYNIYIIPEEYKMVYPETFDYEFPFLYSENQTIYLDDEKDSYELRFKYLYYNNEFIYLKLNSDDYFVLDNCQLNEKEIICNIEKKKLQENLSTLGEYSLYFYIDKGKYYKFKSVLSINIKYRKTIVKEKLDVSITKLLSNTSDYVGAIAFETNVNSDKIPDLVTDTTFSVDFNGSFECNFRKNYPNNLLLLCHTTSTGVYYLNISQNEISLTDIHYKYDFTLLPNEDNITFSAFYPCIIIYNTYPIYIDLTLNESVSLKYFVLYTFNMNHLRLNPDSDDLQCYSYVDFLDCELPLSHFKNKASGYYYTYHLNNNGTWQILYDANPIYVKLPYNKIEMVIEDKDNNNLIKIGQKGTIYLVTNYKDIANLFTPSELEKFTFPGTFTDSKENRLYESTCRLWKPENENIRIICQLKENLQNTEHKIYLNEINFIYNKDYNITIYYKAENIIVKQLNSEISFLYSDKQNIQIKKDKKTYILSFKQLLYDNRQLYLYKNDMKEIRLHNCQNSNNELRCNINKDEILEILSFNNEKYNLAEKIDSEGLYIFHSVLDITFNYDISQNEVKLKIVDLLTPELAKNEFIAYKTNIENIPVLTTDYFEIDIIKNQKINCIFKKSYNHINLLLLCNATEDGINSLGKISQIILDKINIFYKFIIEEFENKQAFNVSNEGTKISSLYPLELDFTKKDSYIITYETEYPDRLEGLKLNSESSKELDCINKYWYKECIVNKTHFTKSGNYYTYHNNHLGKKTISYEAPIIKIILEEKREDEPEDDDNYDLILGLVIPLGIIVIIIIIIIVWYYCKKKGKRDENISTEVDNKNLYLPISSQVEESFNKSEVNENKINN